MEGDPNPSLGAAPSLRHRLVILLRSSYSRISQVFLVYNRGMYGLEDSEFHHLQYGISRPRGSRISMEMPCLILFFANKQFPDVKLPFCTQLFGELESIGMDAHHEHRATFEFH